MCQKKFQNALGICAFSNVVKEKKKISATLNYLVSDNCNIFFFTNYRVLFEKKKIGAF